MEPPQAHAFYVLSPLAFVFAAYLVDVRRLTAGAARSLPCVLALNVALHAGLT